MDQELQELQRAFRERPDDMTRMRLASMLARSGHLLDAFELLLPIRRREEAQQVLETALDAPRVSSNLRFAGVPGLATEPKVLWSVRTDSLGVAVDGATWLCATGVGIFIVGELGCAVLDLVDGSVLGRWRHDCRFHQVAVMGRWIVRLAGKSLEVADALTGSAVSRVGLSSMAFSRIECDFNGVACLTPEGLLYFHISEQGGVTPGWVAAIPVRGEDSDLSLTSEYLIVCDSFEAFKPGLVHVVRRSDGSPSWSGHMTRAWGDERGLLTSHGNTSLRQAKWNGEVEWDRPWLGVDAVTPERLVASRGLGKPRVLLDRCDGTVAAQLDQESSSIGAMLAVNGVVYGGLRNGIRAYDSTSGVLLWRKELGEASRYICLAAAPHRLYALSSSHVFHLA